MTAATSLGSALHLAAGTTSTDRCALQVTPASAGWTYSGLSVVELEPGDTVTWETGPAETLVLSLSGSCEVTCDDETLTVQGRRDVFSGPSDFVYLPREATARITSPGGGRFALTWRHPSASIQDDTSHAVDLVILLHQSRRRSGTR